MEVFKNLGVFTLLVSKSLRGAIAILAAFFNAFNFKHMSKVAVHRLLLSRIVLRYVLTYYTFI